ncbi:MAG: Rpn family recombination-promoting nuclease/putative transposase [Acetatifactor sp.]|nr:Rpn family recombination-promoting nuclease/putative transposase [Acetatifactor sp.]
MNNGVRRPMQELNLTDRFLFAETMDEPEAYEAAVGILLEKEIVLPGPSQTEKELRISPLLRSVRLDVLSVGEDGKIYFTEMQKTDTGNLKKRSRYYQAQLDVSLLEPGSKDFNLLNDSCMILVAPFDLFGHGSYRYTFEGQCKEIPGLPLQDGATRIFINTRGENREVFSQEFLDFMEYINDTRDEVAARSGSARIKLIHNRVEKVRHSEKCGVKYMQRWEEIAYARQDGYEAGALREVLAAVCKKLAKGKGEEQIAEELEKTPEEIHWICEVARKYAPAYNQDTIYQELRA